MSGHRNLKDFPTDFGPATYTYGRAFQVGRRKRLTTSTGATVQDPRDWERGKHARQRLARLRERMRKIASESIAGSWYNLPVKKLLVWDGDETLWTGTLTAGDTPTLPADRFDLCETLCARGVLQSLASHNHLADAQEALVALGLEPFFLHTQAAFGVAKSAMIAAIIDGYGLSKPEDVVFLDDDPFNRHEVQERFPTMTVAGPYDVIRIVQDHFTADHYTDEDQNRVRRYRSDQARLQAALSYGEDYQAFLRSCEMVLTMSPAKPSDAPRIVDLAKRANRFAAASISLDNPRPFLNRVYVGRVRDRFGDHGLSALVVVESDNPDMLEIEALVISCRLQGRGVGSAVLGWTLKHFPRPYTVARWQKTEYNGGVPGLYEWYKFAIHENEGWMAATLVTTPAVTLPPWIHVE